MTSALQAIVFDFDGVIADSEPLHLRAFQKILSEEGLELEYPRLLRATTWATTMLDSSGRWHGIALSSMRWTSCLPHRAQGHVLQEMLQDARVLFPGAADFIRAAAAEVPIAIASGALRHEILEILQSAGLDGLFTAVVAAGDTGESKPSPAPYLLAFEQLQRHAPGRLDSRRCVAIEDSHWGIESARDAGLRCVGSRHELQSRRAAGAELVVGSLGQLTVPTWIGYVRSHERVNQRWVIDAQESR